MSEPTDPFTPPTTEPAAGPVPPNKWVHGCLGVVAGGALCVAHLFVTGMLIAAATPLGVAVGILGLVGAVALFFYLLKRGDRPLAIGYAIAWVLYLVVFGGCIALISNADFR